MALDPRRHSIPSMEQDSDSDSSSSESSVEEVANKKVRRGGGGSGKKNNSIHHNHVKSSHGHVNSSEEHQAMSHGSRIHSKSPFRSAMISSGAMSSMFLPVDPNAPPSTTATGINFGNSLGGPHPQGFGIYPPGVQQHGIMGETMKGVGGEEGFQLCDKWTITLVATVLFAIMSHPHIQLSISKYMNRKMSNPSMVLFVMPCLFFISLRVSAFFL